MEEETMHVLYSKAQPMMNDLQQLQLVLTMDLDQTLQKYGTTQLREAFGKKVS